MNVASTLAKAVIGEGAKAEFVRKLLSESKDVSMKLKGKPAFKISNTFGTTSTETTMKNLKSNTKIEFNRKSLVDPNNGLKEVTIYIGSKNKAASNLELDVIRKTYDKNGELRLMSYDIGGITKGFDSIAKAREFLKNKINKSVKK